MSLIQLPCSNFHCSCEQTKSNGLKMPHWFIPLKHSLHSAVAWFISSQSSNCGSYYHVSFKLAKYSFFVSIRASAASNPLRSVNNATRRRKLISNPLLITKEVILRWSWLLMAAGTRHECAVAQLSGSFWFIRRFSNSWHSRCQAFKHGQKLGLDLYVLLWSSNVVSWAESAHWSA